MKCRRCTLISCKIRTKFARDPPPVACSDVQIRGPWRWPSGAEPCATLLCSALPGLGRHHRQHQHLDRGGVRSRPPHLVPAIAVPAARLPLLRRPRTGLGLPQPGAAGSGTVEAGSAHGQCRRRWQSGHTNSRSSSCHSPHRGRGPWIPQEPSRGASGQPGIPAVWESAGTRTRPAPSPAGGDGTTGGKPGRRRNPLPHPGQQLATAHRGSGNGLH